MRNTLEDQMESCDGSVELSLPSGHLTVVKLQCAVKLILSKPILICPGRV